MEGNQKLIKKLMNVWHKMPNYMKKDKRNDHFRYTYLSEKKIKETVGPLLKEEGILFHVDVEDVNTLQLEKQVLTTVTVRYTFTDVESGEALSGKFFGQGADPGDKGIYKAVTGAIKYIFTSMFLVPSGDDPENDDNTATTELKKEKSIANKLYKQLRGLNPEKAAQIVNEFKGKLNTPEGIKAFNKALSNAIATAKKAAAVNN